VIRSAADEDGVLLLVRGLGYSLLASTFGTPSIWVSASTRAQANAIAADLRAAGPGSGGTRPSAGADDDRPPGQYL
jgi:hypothetical protein